MLGIFMFILGGFVSAIIFYPGWKKEKQIDLDYLACMLSYQWYCGVSQAQNRKEIPVLPETFIELVSFSPQAKANFKNAAEIVAKRIFK